MAKNTNNSTPTTRARLAPIDYGALSAPTVADVVPTAKRSSRWESTPWAGWIETCELGKWYSVDVPDDGVKTLKSDGRSAAQAYGLGVSYREAALDNGMTRVYWRVAPKRNYNRSE